MGQQLEGDLAAELGVGRPPHLPHAALAQLGGKVDAHDVDRQQQAGANRFWPVSSYNFV